MKTVNVILMVLMAILALREGMDIVRHGPSATNVIFGLLFATFAVRRFMLMSGGKGSVI
jgi:lipopolysaccharide export LptBFGC system permease protein LptF